MKKIILILFAAALVLNTGCATIMYGGQEHCPPGQPRKIHTGALLCDILLLGFFPLIIDLADGAIYKPCDKPVSK